MATVCILGAGFGGLAAAIRLRRAGHEVQVLERAATVGGTWRDNRYPGVACDVRSHLYSLSFAPNPDWSHRYAQGAEIQAYLERLQAAHQLPIRFGSDVVLQEWLGDRWRLTCRDGHTVEARFVVNAIGALRDPRLPDLPGRFDGPEMHSARWDPSVELSGKRVGVIGTGASAIQVIPGLVDTVGELHVFQRTPAWVVSRDDHPYPAWSRWMFRNVPGWMALRRLAIYLSHEVRYPLAFGRLGAASRLFRWSLERHIRQQVSDPSLAARLTPDYQPGCKRILISDDYYPAMTRPHVRLHSAVRERLPTGVRTADADVPLDALIYCTGFRVDEPLGGMDVRGVGGRSLRQVWAARPQAYMGVTVPGFPNSFMLLGPNTALGHSSVLVMIEAQIRWIEQAIRLAGSGRVDTRTEALDAFLGEVDEQVSSQVWMSGCQSWYLSRGGQNFTIWPGSTLSYLWRMRRLDRSALVVSSCAESSTNPG